MFQHRANIPLTMFPILSLPNELLHRIVHAVPWPDLVPFALSCKIIHICCASKLKDRLALKRYSVLTFGGFDLGESMFCDQEAHETLEELEDPGVDAKHNALLLLGSILDEPDVARWPMSMRIGYLCDEDQDYIVHGELDDDHLDKMQQIVAQHSTGLKKIIDECLFIPQVDKASTFESLCQPPGEVVAVRLLLTLLPNVKSIAFQSNSHGIEKLAEVVERIAVANRDPTSHLHSKALRHLSKISIDRADTEMGKNAHIYGPFAMLPSLKTIQGCKIDGDSFEWPENHHDSSSNVTEIDIKHSAMSSAAFTGLISGIATLKKFTYHHAGPIVGDGRYDPAGIVAALRQHAAHSLVLLNITADQYALVLDEDGDQHVGSLRLFQALKNIRLDENAFQFRIRDPLDNVQASTGEQSYEDEVSTEKDDEDSTEEDQWERLVDILPASVQTFKLVQYSDPRDTRKLFEGMANQIAEKLPALKTIRFEHEHDEPLKSDLVKELKDAGLILKSWNLTI